MLANLTAIMDGLATLVTDAGLAVNVYAFPPDDFTVPCAVVGYPTEILFDITAQRGGDQMTLPLWFAVGLSNTKSARDALSTILGDASSIKSTLDGAQSFGDVRVTDATIDRITVASGTYLAAKFDVEVI